MTLSPRQIQRHLSPLYGEAIDQLETLDSDSAAIVRRYVSALRSECAVARIEANEMRALLAVTHE